MNPSTNQQGVALGAMALAVIAAVWAGASSARDDRAWLQAVEQGDDHVDALSLAADLMSGRGDVAVVDVRPAAEFAAWHLPGSINLSLPEVAGDAGKPIFAGSPRLVVLCSNGATHPGQGWVALRQQGHDNVRVLDGGLDAFKAEVLTPPSLQSDDEARARAMAPLFALRRAFFLGDGGATAHAVWATDPELLTEPTMVSTRWLAGHLGRVVVLDSRERAEDFAVLHLPGAVHMPLGGLRQKVGDRDLDLLPADQLAARFGAAGLERSTPVVIYADDKMQDATLLALALLRTGHRALAILEGGMLRWATERRALVAAVAPPLPKTYEPLPHADDFTVTADDVRKAIAAGSTVLDVRPPDFYRGEKSTEARPGHIPGAVNRLFSKDNVRTDDGTWLRPRAELLAEYAAVGVSPDKPVVVHCRTGHTASETYFVLRHLLGYKDVHWFNGSWTEWAARSDLPAAMGDGKNDRQ
jgi:thiosulfate/3-mercaptopyruvate sulfurtransferase